MGNPVEGQKMISEYNMIDTKGLFLSAAEAGVQFLTPSYEGMLMEMVLARFGLGNVKETLTRGLMPVGILCWWQ